MLSSWLGRFTFTLIFMSLYSYASPSEMQVSKVLDAFHQAASDAEGARYFSLLSDDSIFIGTDASERWTKTQFETFAAPYFSQGKGWTYIPRDRNISFTSVSADVAWFDELLDNEKYGECRGTGVVIKTRQGWKISQYHLTIPIPNDVTEAAVSLINSHIKEQK